MGAPTKRDVISALPILTRGVVDVFTPEEVGFPVLLHISHDASIKKFIPRISGRTMSAEDKTVPRVSVASSISECVAGHGSTDWFHIDNGDFNKLWQVYGFDYEYAVQPKTSLLPDGAVTNEYWLVTYNKATTEYVPKKVGTFFYSAITYRKITKVIEFDMYINAGEDGIRFSDDIFLEKGYWFIKGKLAKKTVKKVMAGKPLEVLAMRPSSKSEFDKEHHGLFTFQSVGARLSLNW